MSAKPEFDELAMYVEGALTQSRAAEIEALVGAVPEVRAKLDSVRSLVGRISEVDPTAEQLDLIPGLHAAIAASHAAPASRSPWRWFLGGVAAAGFAAAAAVLLLTSGRIRANDFHAKGAGSPSAAQWAGVETYRVEHGQAVGRVDRTLHAGEALAFAYRNGGDQPYAHLAIFAVDLQGHVFWYYPAWTRPQDDPQSIDIRSTEEAVRLPEAVQQAYGVGPLRVHALFSRRPLHVSEVESKLRGASPDAALALPDGFDQEVELDVVP